MSIPRTLSPLKDPASELCTSRSQKLAAAIAEQLVALEDSVADNRPAELSEDAVEMLLALGDAIKAQSDATGGQLQKLDGKMDSLKVDWPWFPCAASHPDVSTAAVNPR